MNGLDLAQPMQRALSACQNCKQRKKKCDRSLPKCSSCTRFRRLCNYPDSSGTPTESAAVVITNHHTGHTSLLSGSLPRSRTVSAVSQKTAFPPGYFLDFSLSRANLQELRELPCVHSISVPPEIQCLVNTIADRRNIASNFFGDLYHCLPFVSKKICYEKGLNPSMLSRVDVSLLFACMRLVQTTPPTTNARTAEYLSLKVALLEAELAGILTLRLLQSLILVAFYELGHAIYPSAYLSIGTCARFATALGLYAFDSFDSHIPYMEVEEKRRTWWAIVILDRFVNVGSPERPLATGEFQNDVPLPIEDTAWENGDYEYVQSVTTSLPPSPTTGRFGLLCLASNILGVVLQQISSKSQSDLDSPSKGREAFDKALSRYNNISLEKGSAKDVGLYNSRTISYSALFLSNINSVESLRTDDCHHTIRDTRLDLSEEVLAAVKGTPRDMLSKIATPFDIDAIYQAAATFTQLYVETKTPESFDALAELKRSLELINERWKSAGAYLELLESLEARCVERLKKS